MDHPKADIIGTTLLLAKIAAILLTALAGLLAESAAGALDLKTDPEVDKDKLRKVLEKFKVRRKYLRTTLIAAVLVTGLLQVMEIRHQKSEDQDKATEIKNLNAQLRNLQALVGGPTKFTSVSGTAIFQLSSDHPDLKSLAAELDDMFAGHAQWLPGLNPLKNANSVLLSARLAIDDHLRKEMNPLTNLLANLVPTQLVPCLAINKSGSTGGWALVSDVTSMKHAPSLQANDLICPNSLESNTGEPLIFYSFKTHRFYVDIAFSSDSASWSTHGTIISITDLSDAKLSLQVHYTGLYSESILLPSASGGGLVALRLGIGDYPCEFDTLTCTRLSPDGTDLRYDVTLPDSQTILTHRATNNVPRPFNVYP